MTRAEIESKYNIHIECGDGWVGIISHLISQLEVLIPGFTIQQIKEKFGALRFYFTVPDNVRDVTTAAVSTSVRAAERESEITCELCGASAKNESKGSWYRTRCHIHRSI